MHRYVILLAMLAACGDSPSGPPSSSPTYDLVFEGYLTATPELLMLDSAAGQIKRLLPVGRVVTDPKPSPDGARIAFVVANPIEGTGDIFVINRDGSGLTQITTEGALDDQPSWSPDGQRIAFRSFRTQRDGDIWVMNADGTNAVNLTPDPLPGVTDERRPAWSPDGTRIAYASNAGGDYDLWVMNSNGSNPQRITNSPDFDTEPAWSPNSTILAFRRSTAGGNSEIALIPAAGGTAQPLAQAGEQRMPVWSPGGERIVFVHQASVAVRADIHSMRSDGTDIRVLISDFVAGGSLSPAFLRRR